MAACRQSKIITRALAGGASEVISEEMPNDAIAVCVSVFQDEVPAANTTIDTALGTEEIQSLIDSAATGLIAANTPLRGEDFLKISLTAHASNTSTFRITIGYLISLKD